MVAGPKLNDGRGSVRSNVVVDISKPRNADVALELPLIMSYEGELTETAV
jgi:hypothetical protein